MLRRRLTALLACSLTLLTAHARDLAVGDALPDTSSIPIAALDQDFAPKAYGNLTPEGLLVPDGVLILHFCAPRPPRHTAFKVYFTEELSALRKAALSVSYPCRAVVMLPFGGKGRQDAKTLLELAAKEKTLPWGGGVEVYYEPTFPRPGLYLTCRPDDEAVSTPYTFVLGPDRKVLAVRPAGDDHPLYDWLQANLPDRLQLPVGRPLVQLDLPPAGPATWPTFRRSSTGVAVADRTPNTLPYLYLAWKHKIGPTFASPAVADGIVYASTQRKGLRSLRLDTGEELGAFATGESWWTSPVVAGDLVYTASTAGLVSAVERDGLKVRWQRSLSGLITSSPTIRAGALYVGSRKGAVYALDASNGDILWSFQTGGEVSSSPVLAGTTVLIGSGDRRLYALDAATGEAKWSATTSGAVDSSPTVVGGAVVVGSFDGGLYSFRLSDGRPNWRCELGGWVHSSPAVAGSLAVAGTVRTKKDQRATLNWVDLATGKKVASRELPDSVYSTPVVWDDLVLVGCRDHSVYAFDRTGQRRDPVWAYATNSYVHATPVVVGDTVLVSSYDGYVYALRQAKPIAVWTREDVMPRWFMAALVKQLHEEAGRLIARAATGEVGQPLSLTPFDSLYQALREQAAQPAPVDQVLPSDVAPEHPGARYVAYTLAAGLLSGYPDGQFHPSDPTPRYQFAAALGATLDTISRPDFAWRALRERNGGQVTVEVQVRPTAGRRTTPPADVESTHWAFRALSEMAKRGLLSLDDENRVRGERQVTVADAAVQWGLLAEAIKVVRTK